jgi:hypothetical protein
MRTTMQVDGGAPLIAFNRDVNQLGFSLVDEMA